MRLRATRHGYQARPVHQWFTVDAAAIAALAAVIVCVAFAVRDALQ